MWNWKKWIACVLLCLMILSVALPVGSATAAQIETGRRGELTIEYLYDNEPVAGAEFQVYRVVEISGDGMYRLTGHFEDYPVEVNGLTDTEMANAALTLQGFAQRDQVEPDYTVVTEENGTAKLTELATGLYLIVGKPLVTEEGTYTTKPQLVSLPTFIGGEWIYSITLKFKCGFVKPPEFPVEKKVQKIWNDEGGEENRPASITVHLLKDGEIFDTVELSAANRWRYVWTNLPEGYEWTVVEETPEGYFVVVQELAGWFVIVNTLPGQPDEPAEPSEPTSPPETTEPIEPSEPSEPSQPSEPGQPTESTVPTIPTQPMESSEPTEPSVKPGEPDGPELPQTGMLWWPVPLMLAAGLALMILGGVLRRKKHDET